jgi:hypothetical protein
MYSGEPGPYFLVDIRLKLGSKRHSTFLLLHLVHGPGAFFLASQASFTWRQALQLFARPMFDMISHDDVFTMVVRSFDHI